VPRACNHRKRAALTWEEIDHGGMSDADFRAHLRCERDEFFALVEELYGRVTNDGIKFGHRRPLPPWKRVAVFLHYAGSLGSVARAPVSAESARLARSVQARCAARESFLVCHMAPSAR
jgi:hypothetical protein